MKRLPSFRMICRLKSQSLRWNVVTSQRRKTVILLRKTIDINLLLEHTFFLSDDVIDICVSGISEVLQINNLPYEKKETFKTIRESLFKNCPQTKENFISTIWKHITLYHSIFFFQKSFEWKLDHILDSYSGLLKKVVIKEQNFIMNTFFYHVYV